MIKLAVSGAKGRMGQTICDLASKSKQFELTTLIEHSKHPDIGSESHGLVITCDNDQLKECDALIEFTLPDGTIENLNAAVKHNVKMVIGTTGFSEEQTKHIHQSAHKIPLVFASNMSIGVNILFKLIEITSKRIDAQSIHLTETHHIHKKDKPSGTAKTMKEIAEKHSQLDIPEVDAIREGEVIGDHSIIFESAEDTLEIKHHAKNRTMFAKGALTAASYLMNQSNGLYTMQDVLGLNQI